MKFLSLVLEDLCIADPRKEIFSSLTIGLSIQKGRPSKQLANLVKAQLRVVSLPEPPWWVTLLLLKGAGQVRSLQGLRVNILVVANSELTDLGELQLACPWPKIIILYSCPRLVNLGPALSQGLTLFVINCPMFEISASSRPETVTGYSNVTRFDFF
jgi:hypothetical protein